MYLYSLIYADLSIYARIYAKLKIFITRRGYVRFAELVPNMAGAYTTATFETNAEDVDLMGLRSASSQMPSGT